MLRELVLHSSHCCRQRWLSTCQQVTAIQFGRQLNWRTSSSSKKVRAVAQDNELQESFQLKSLAWSLNFITCKSGTGFAFQSSAAKYPALLPTFEDVFSSFCSAVFANIRTRLEAAAALHSCLLCCVLG